MRQMRIFVMSARRRQPTCDKLRHGFVPRCCDDQENLAIDPRGGRHLGYFSGPFRVAKAVKPVSDRGAVPCLYSRSFGNDAGGYQGGNVTGYPSWWRRIRTRSRLKLWNVQRRPSSIRRSTPSPSGSRDLASVALMLATSSWLKIHGDLLTKNRLLTGPRPKRTLKVSASVVAQNSINGKPTRCHRGRRRPPMNRNGPKRCSPVGRSPCVELLTTVHPAAVCQAS
jgi:hypothetical protein